MSATRRLARRGAAGVTGALLLAGLTSQTVLATELPATPANAATQATDTTTELRASVLLPWYVSPSLVALRSEVNARWPNRDRSSDGTIGDTLHQARSNSHNAVGHPGGPSVGTTGAVHAMDITAAGIDVQTLLDAVIGDSRVWYVIYGGRIWSRTYGWVAQSYSGDPHTSHIHVNLREDSQAAAVSAETDTSRWLTGSAKSSSARGAATIEPASWTTLSTSTTQALQRALIAAGYSIPAGATGTYGAQTMAAVRAYQQAQGWTGSGADGYAGATTLRRLGVAASGSADTSTASAVADSRSSTGSTSRSGASSGYKPGTASREVYFMQQALIKLGYAIPAGATGYYGAKTVDAVRAFQQAQGWTGTSADGVAGAGTLRRLGLA